MKSSEALRKVQKMINEYDILYCCNGVERLKNYGEITSYQKEDLINKINNHIGGQATYYLFLQERLGEIDYNIEMLSFLRCKMLDFLIAKYEAKGE